MRSFPKKRDRHLVWINPDVIRYGHRIEDVGIHAVIFLEQEPPELVVLNLYEKDFGEFKATGGFVVKAQVWHCRGDDWEAASPVFERKYSE